MKRTWPRKMWCVCYRDSDYPGGWAPYAGHAYWYRADATLHARELVGKVKAFSMKPWPTSRRGPEQ